MAKNKGTQPGELRRVIDAVKDDWKEFRKNVVDSADKFRKEWADKFNDLNDRFKKLTFGMAKQLAGISANQQIHSDVIEKLDINVQVIGKMIKDVYGRIEQIDMLMEASEVNFKHDFDNQEIEKIKSARDQTFQDVMSESYRIVHEERKAALEQRRKEAEQAAVEASKAKTAAEEAEMADLELKESERPTLVGEPGGPGAEVPAGADVFGG